MWNEYDLDNSLRIPSSGNYCDDNLLLGLETDNSSEYNGRYLVITQNDAGRKIDLFRTWQAVVDVTGNSYLEPDYHYELIGNSVTVEDVLSFRTAEGGFLHTRDGTGNNQMTLEQAFYGLVDAYRVEQGMSSLYRITPGRAPGMGLEGKDQDVQPKAVTKPGITFGDVSENPYREAIEALASREIINGMGDGSFAPDKTMTRAEYATIVVKALGLTAKANGKFSDVAASAWYAGYIGTANSYGIVNGRSDTEFDPSGTITRQEAAVMTVRAAKLCGLDTGMSEAQIARAMWGYTDFGRAASWAKEALAWCYGQGLLTATDIKINPTEDVLRGEVADMLYRMLSLANLL